MITRIATPDERGGAPEMAEALAQAILSGTFAPGDTFPREMDLCQHFQVSRNRVRNALASLASAGLVERTAGRGTRVRNIDEWHLLDPQVSGWIATLATPHPSLLREIFAFRLAAEPYVAELAALNATAEDLAAIEAAFAGMSRTADAQALRHEHAEHDLAFHAAIYRASHNLVWHQMGHLLRPSITVLIQHSHYRAGSLADSLARHRRVMEAIRQRQPEAARQAAEQVLERTARDLGVNRGGRCPGGVTASRIAPDSRSSNDEEPE